MGLAVTCFLAVSGGLLTFMGGLIAYIFNTRIKEIDRRQTDFSSTCQSRQDATTEAIDKLRENENSQLGELKESMTQIQIDVAALRQAELMRSQGAK